jgi:ABC-type sugar transport system substrate-binding protein
MFAACKRIHAGIFEFIPDKVYLSFLPYLILSAAFKMKKQSSHSTLTDVARAAGVGTTTVSRVINGGERVSQETLARVQAVIEELGYQPSQAARILRGERTKTIGLIVPSIADSFFSTVTEVAQEIARAHDSLLIVTVSNNDPSIELENLNVLIRHRTDGLLLAPAHSENRSLANMLDKLSIPSVTFDRAERGQQQLQGREDCDAALDYAWVQANPVPWRRKRSIYDQGAHSRIQRGCQASRT